MRSCTETSLTNKSSENSRDVVSKCDEPVCPAPVPPACEGGYGGCCGAGTPAADSDAVLRTVWGLRLTGDRQTGLM